MNIEQQKQFILDSVNFFNPSLRLAILTVVMMEVGQSAVIESGAKKEVYIDLNVISSTNKDVITHIYNLVLARKEVLNQPIQ